MSRKAHIFRDLFVLAGYLLVIAVALPFSEYAARRAVQEFPQFSSTVTTVVLFYLWVIGTILAIYVIAGSKKFKILRLIVLALILAAAFYGVNGLANAYDKLHVITYSLLAFLLFRVLRFYNPTTALYFWCVIFTGIAGCVDEIGQALIPGRGCSLSDVVTDFGAAALTVLAIALVIVPKLEKWRIRIDFFKEELHTRQAWVDNYKWKRSQ